MQQSLTKSNENVQITNTESKQSQELMSDWQTEITGRAKKCPQCEQCGQQLTAHRMQSANGRRQARPLDGAYSRHPF